MVGWVVEDGAVLNRFEYRIEKNGNWYAVEQISAKANKQASKQQANKTNTINNVSASNGQITFYLYFIDGVFGTEHLFASLKLLCIYIYWKRVVHVHILNEP